jgi:hypothetical protein
LLSFIFNLHVCTSAGEIAPAQAPQCNKLNQYNAIMHVHTKLSSGEYSLPQLTQIATSQQIDAIFLSDGFIENIQYGLFPLRHILWARYINKSIISCGIQNYQTVVAEENKRQTNILYIPGLELTPRIYWSGSFLKNNLICHNHQRNLILLNIPGEETIQKLSIICGFMPGRDAFIVFITRLVLAFFIIALIATIFIAPSIAHKAGYKTSVIRKAMLFALLLPSLVLMIIINSIINFIPLYDIYSQDAPEKFEQKIIDELNQKNTLHFWAHPEAFDHHDFPKYHFSIDTRAYPEILFKTKKYTGFAGINEGANNIILAGKLWDTLLTKYTEGSLQSPAWCFGEMLYHYEGQAGKKLSNVETVILSKDRTEKSLLAAVKNGQFYARRNYKSQKLILEEFSINGIISGDTLLFTSHSNAPIDIFLSANSIIPDEPISISIICNGLQIYTTKTNTPCYLNLTEHISESGNCYYRAIITGKYPLTLVSNPIFIKNNY